MREPLPFRLDVGTADLEAAYLCNVLTKTFRELSFANQWDVTSPR